MSSESDDDLLALAGAGGSETEDEQAKPSPAPQANDDTEEEQQDEGEDDEEEESPDVPPYPLQNKFKSVEDREYLMGLPELERESILFDRAEEMRSFRERQYLKQRAAQQAVKEVPAARSTRQGTSAKLQELKRRRMARHKDSESESEASEASEQEASASESEFDSDASEPAARKRQRKPVEWAEPERETLAVNDINAARWGKSDFQQCCHYPGFAQVVRGCFVRVSVGEGRYIVGQVVDLQKCEPYTFGDRRKVDEKVVVSYAGEEQPVEMGSCSDGKFTEQEFERWTQEMNTKDRSLPTPRQVQAKARETRREQTRTLTTEEIAEMVARRQELAGLSGSHLHLVRSSLREQRQAALEESDAGRVAEIDEKLRGLEKKERKPARTSHSALDVLSERNRRSNLASVRKAEVQAQVERRRSGNVVKADPFSRLRTNAKTFYTNDGPIAQMEPPEAAAAERVRPNSIDSMIAKIDIELKIVI